MIYLARKITRARYIENDIGWYISLEKLLKRDILKMILVDISCSRNYSSEIYIKNGIRWYISLKKLLVHDISKMGLFDISCSSYYSSEIYQKWDWLIYLAQVNTGARYIENGIGWYILLKLLLEQDISKIGLVDISCSRNYLSKIYRKWIWLIYRDCSGKCWKYGRRNCTNNYDKNAYLLIVWNLNLHYRIFVLHLLL